MMTITSTHRGRTLKRVTFANASGATDDALATAAMRATGERPSMLFGYDVTRHDGDAATVTLHTD